MRTTWQPPAASGRRSAAPRAEITRVHLASSTTLVGDTPETRLAKCGQRARQSADARVIHFARAARAPTRNDAPTAQHDQPARASRRVLVRKPASHALEQRGERRPMTERDAWNERERSVRNAHRVARRWPRARSLQREPTQRARTPAARVVLHLESRQQREGGVCTLRVQLVVNHRAQAVGESLACGGALVPHLACGLETEAGARELMLHGGVAAGGVGDARAQLARSRSAASTQHVAGRCSLKLGYFSRAPRQFGYVAGAAPRTVQSSQVVGNCSE